MSNLFQDVLNDANGVQNELLGPTYPYYQNIQTPSQIGMSSNGDLQTLGNDINGLIQYVEVLVTGNSQASSTGGPLGNKFFLPTGAKCLVVEQCSSNGSTTTCQQAGKQCTINSDGSTTCDTNGQQTVRNIYVNNVPNGNIPFISQGLGVDFTDFEGLIPGAMGNLNALNPYGIMQSFLSGSTPPCQEITMETIDTNNNQSTATQYVTVVDIQNMDPCNFQNGSNPITGQGCQQAFTNRVSNKSPSIQLPSDPLAKLYFAGLAAFGVYIVYRLMDKSK
jgi:hypothetical protein